jgi:hypothetical protein
MPRQRQTVKPVRLKAGIRHSTRQNPYERIPRAVTGFQARAIPCLLARSFHRPKSWSVSRREGCPAGGGLRGRRRTSPTVAERSQVFGRFRVSGVQTRLTRPNPSGSKGHFSVLYTSLRPWVNSFVASATRRFFGRAWPIGHAQPDSP